VNRTLTKKLIYVIAALAMLAMLIPAMAVPVGASRPHGPPGDLSMVLIDPITNLPTDADSGYDILGSRVQITYTVNPNNPGWQITGWNITNLATANGASPAYFVSDPGTGPVAVVTGVHGDAEIICNLSKNGVTDYLSVEKKWGKIDSTDITPPGSSYVTWSEEDKEWHGHATITDTVNGVFYEENDPAAPHVMQGTILNFYLVKGDVTVDMTCKEAKDLKAYVEGLDAAPDHVGFQYLGPDATYEGRHHWLKSHAIGVSGPDGTYTIGLKADGEESVQVVVIPEYPFPDINLNVCPEVTSWDFYTTEMEVVPQVRWAGEKIVLEKWFGDSYAHHWVKFALQNQSVGALEPIDGEHTIVLGAEYWVEVNHDGCASIILVSSDEGVANVTAALYDRERREIVGDLINQHYFMVYFLKFESLTLGDVHGKREFHNDGAWMTGDEVQPTNPWDPTGSYMGTVDPPIPDLPTQNANVSQDTLLRARVRGWFTSLNPSWRPARYMDPYNSTLDKDPNTQGTLLLPAGRWILPDDWAALAGPNWTQSRLHWDIMCAPYSGVMSEDPLGNDGDSYENENIHSPPAPVDEPTVAGPNVIGPFSPGLEEMTPKGWEVPNDMDDHHRQISTVVPDGALGNTAPTSMPAPAVMDWDAPMPPAKIIFQIQKVNPGNEAGFFKAVDKADIYYVISLEHVLPPYADYLETEYTNPFYAELIPAHQAIPAFINNGGYDWDSFDHAYGPYYFWEFVNQNTYLPLVKSADPAGHPTNVSVYSDNHGEAMVYLNGNWNLVLTPFFYKAGTVDIPINAVVGHTTVQATADYPYARLHQAIQSNKDVKTWLWGGQVLGIDGHASDGFFGDGSPDPASTDTRMVLSAGNYDPNTKTGNDPNAVAKSTDKVIWVWVTDRDGKRDGVRGAKVTWTLGATLGAGAKINNVTGKGISDYNAVTLNIWLDNGFLKGTGGVITDPLRQSGYSFLRDPVFDPLHPNDPTVSAEGMLFNKFWGPNGTSGITADVNGYCVAAIDIESLSSFASRVQVNVDITSHDFDLTMVPPQAPGTVQYETNVDFNVADYLDDGITVGDANCDGAVNMGDVVAVERMILGYSQVTSNAIVNKDGSVDMGTVVKIERKILGLK